MTGKVGKPRTAGKRRADAPDLPEDKEGKHGVQSFEIGMQVLQAVLRGHRGMMLKEIAASAGMPASKVHRYLVSMIRSGLVEQDRASSRYDLGPLALNIGLVATDRLDRIQAGLSAIADLRDAINEATALAAWSENGPIVVRWERPQRPIAVSVVTGTALSLITTAVGRTFAAYLPPVESAPLIEKELQGAALPRELRSRAAVARLLDETRTSGVSIVERHHLVPGVVSVAAPVFDAAGEITLAIGVVGIQGMLDMRREGPVVAALKSAAQRLSSRLGHRGAEASAAAERHAPPARR